MLSQADYVKLTKRWPLQKDCVAFYGNPRDRSFEENHITNIRCPWNIFYEGQSVTGNIIRVNKKCADSLKRVFDSVWELVHEDQSAIEALRYHKYSGSFVMRNKRGGTTMSMHAFGAAIDWDDEDNPHHSQRHLFDNNSPLIQAFKAEGWIWGGDWHRASVDAMHVQSSRVY